MADACNLLSGHGLYYAKGVKSTNPSAARYYIAEKLNMLYDVGDVGNVTGHKIKNLQVVGEKSTGAKITEAIYSYMSSHNSSNKSVRRLKRIIEACYDLNGANRDSKLSEKGLIYIAQEFIRRDAQVYNPFIFCTGG